MSTKWIWMCLALGAAAVALLAWVGGGDWRLLALAALLLVCPLLIVWIASGGLAGKHPAPPPERK